MAWNQPSLLLTKVLPKAVKSSGLFPWNNSAILRRESTVQVKQFGNAKKILPKDSTETMEIKNKYPFLHQLSNSISDSSIKLMPESTRRLWNFQGLPMQLFGTNSKTTGYLVLCTTHKPSVPSFQSNYRHTQKK